MSRLLSANYKWKNLNPYEVLMLDTDATPEDIKARYRKLSTLVHPDKRLDMPLARDAFEVSNDASTVLLLYYTIAYYTRVPPVPILALILAQAVIKLLLCHMFSSKWQSSAVLQNGLCALLTACVVLYWQTQHRFLHNLPSSLYITHTTVQLTGSQESLSTVDG
jgi:DnaJ domain